MFAVNIERMFAEFVTRSERCRSMQIFISVLYILFHYFIFNFGSFLQKTHKCKSCRSRQQLSKENIPLQKSALIQPRTSPSQFAHTHLPTFRVSGQEKGTPKNEVPGHVGAYTQTHPHMLRAIPVRACVRRISETPLRTYVAPKS